jgi:3-mercaptopyruvate sulfurtransferase SseA
MEGMRLWAAAGVLAAVVAAPATLTPLVGAAGGQVEVATMPRISLAEFRKLFDAGNVVVVDVRSADAYTKGHIPGALSVPLETVDQRVADFKDATKPIVTYCT